MASGYLTGLADIARSAGLKVVEVSGWKTRGHGRMAAVDAIVCHHTAGPKTGNMPSLNTVVKGRPDLAGPLCNYALGRDGTVYVVAAGFAYHAGVVRQHDYGNAYSIGIEAEGTGHDSWPEVQMAAYARLCAALCAHYGLPISRVLGHKEVCAPVGRKTDPNFDMAAFRTRVRSVTAPKTVDDEHRWFKLALINHGLSMRALTKPGETAKWLARRKKAMALATSLGADIVGGIECGSGTRLAYVTKAYAAAGYTRVNSGSTARYFFVGRSVTVLATGHFEPPRYKGDDKPAPWILVDVNGGRALVVLSHLEWRDTTGATQVRQQAAIVADALALAKARGVAPSQVVFLGDTAYEGQLVRERAFKPSGYVDAYTVAAIALNGAVKSYNSFKASVHGPRDDVIAVLGGAKGKGPDRARPVAAMNQRITTLFDHNPLVAVINKQEAAA